jgi:hypothetical protein
MFKIAEPVFMHEWSASFGGRAFPGMMEVHAVGRGNLLAAGRELRVLRCRAEDEGTGKNSKTD